MFAYAADPDKQRGSLHAFLVASSARSLGRVPLSTSTSYPTASNGGQVRRRSTLTRKGARRTRSAARCCRCCPCWIAGCAKNTRRTWRSSRPIAPATAGWSTITAAPSRTSITPGIRLSNLDMPAGREWRPYVLRHSLATLVRNRGAEKRDLEGFTGHRARSQTEVYGEFPSVVRALESVIAEIGKLAPGPPHRNATGASAGPIPVGEA